MKRLAGIGLAVALAAGLFSGCKTGLMGHEGIGPDILVNISANSTLPDNPVVVRLDPGTYAVKPVGKADGGVYDAWKPWCWQERQDKGGWVFGWVNNYQISSDQFAAITKGDGMVYGSAAEALSHAQDAEFTLATTGDVRFFLTDSPVFDNDGGVSLRISRLP
jgi:predicted small secreted protein